MKNKKELCPVCHQPGYKVVTPPDTRPGQRWGHVGRLFHCREVQK